MQVNGVAYTYSSPRNPPQARKPVDKNSELYKVCVDFESLFIKQMLDVMRRTVNKDSLLNGGVSQAIFEDMLYDEYAKKMAETAQFGIAESIYRQFPSK